MDRGLREWERAGDVDRLRHQRRRAHGWCEFPPVLRWLDQRHRSSASLRPPRTITVSGQPIEILPMQEFRVQIVDPDQIPIFSEVNWLDAEPLSGILRRVP